MSWNISTITMLVWRIFVKLFCPWIGCLNKPILLILNAILVTKFYYSIIIIDYIFFKDFNYLQCSLKNRWTNYALASRTRRHEDGFEIWHWPVKNFKFNSDLSLAAMHVMDLLLLLRTACKGIKVSVCYFFGIQWRDICFVCWHSWEGKNSGYLWKCSWLVDLSFRLSYVLTLVYSQGVLSYDSWK